MFLKTLNHWFCIQSSAVPHKFIRSDRSLVLKCCGKSSYYVGQLLLIIWYVVIYSFSIHRKLLKKLNCAERSLALQCFSIHDYGNKCAYYKSWNIYDFLIPSNSNTFCDSPARVSGLKLFLGEHWGSRRNRTHRLPCLLTHKVFLSWV